MTKENRFKLGSMVDLMNDALHDTYELERVKADRDYWKAQYLDLLAHSVTVVTQNTHSMMEAILKGVITIPEEKSGEK